MESARRTALALGSAMTCAALAVASTAVAAAAVASTAVAPAAAASNAMAAPAVASAETNLHTAATLLAAPAPAGATIATAVATAKSTATVNPSSRRAATGRTGMVVSSSPIASQIGIEVLEEGGNAVDAAVAVAFALAVAYPKAGNIGGGGFLLYRDGATGASWVVDFRETAPSRATTGMYLGPDGEPVPDLSRVGYLSTAVPGTVAGLELAHNRYGLLSWKRLLRPAIRLAKKGFPVSPALSKDIGREAAALRRFSSSASIFLPGGKPPAAGSIFRQPDLAGTLKRIYSQGAAGFYRGPVAEAIAADIAAHDGILTASDLASYRARVRQPLEASYDGLKILAVPPPSSGGAIVIEILNMLEPFGLGAFGPRTAKTVHLMTEVERRAYADRSALLGDPGFFDVPLTALTSKQYALARSAGISMDRATPSADVKPGDPNPPPAKRPPRAEATAPGAEAGSSTGSDPSAPSRGLFAAGFGSAAAPGPPMTPRYPPAAGSGSTAMPRSVAGASGEVGIHDSPDTTHYAVVDRWRNIVSVTTTLNDSFGSKAVAAGTGVLLNNEMDDFSAKPGAPNLYGLVGGRANEIRPGKRPLSSMSPTIVLKSNMPYLVLGTPGGSTIITSVLQVFLNMVEFGMTLQEAVDAPRVHHQWLPDGIQIEEGALAPDVQETLRRMGHTISVREPIGDFQAIRIDPARGILEGVSDPRGQGEPRAY